ncbi:beta-galactosidase [Demequina lignilytica]|uniref:Beta-galactosidase n=1 Tax=Demequina lignilytica TaxID=3051663 RepID=A0AB35MJK8_9MICO|nr:beta-galactosidase [Demequina sp. SYSU T0a273]MDN4483907.1 beta-galactosidase [Demequina sp. SYSU T0a273]
MTHQVPTPASGPFPVALDGRIVFGSDYNPEQWPREVWDQDVALMREAGVNLVTVGVFSWSSLEPAPGERTFAWLDEVLNLLADNGIAVDLATPTASPPPWLGVDHPETLAVTADGVRMSAGSRNQFSPSSRVYRDAALAITRDLAARYASHPAVRMWHVGNEYGQVDHGDEAAREFRIWLRDKYGSIESLNRDWGTAVWSQGYRTFEDVVPPRAAPYVMNPTQAVDFRQFSSDQMLAVYSEQRDAIREAGATQPITTNFMGFFPHVDYWSWAEHVDVIADDQYPDPGDPHSPSDIALVQDLMRSLGGGRPWLLMEQAINAVSWRPHNLPKSRERGLLDSYQAVARGADGICFFQWRQASAGSERHHSSMLPHAGADSEVFRTVCELGAGLARLAPVTGGRVDAPVAMLFDWPSWWAGEEPGGLTTRLRTVEQLTRWYRVLWRAGIAVDIVRPGTDLSGYRAVLAPHSYVIGDDAAETLRAAVAAGATVVVGPYSGVADERGHVLTGRSPARIADLLGASGEEWACLPDGDTALAATDAWPSAPAELTATILGERLRADDAEVLATFGVGHLAGLPAITRRRVGEGSAWYAGAVLGDAALAALLTEALDAAGVAGIVPGKPADVEAVRRGDALFLLNHGDTEATVALATPRRDLLSGEVLEGAAVLAPGQTIVLIEGDTP